MKRFVIVGIVVMALASALVGYRVSSHRQQASKTLKPKVSAGSTATDWAPSDAELAKNNQGVGWVFGRIIGVADAPGSLNHSPFVGSPHVQLTNQASVPQ